MKQKIKKFLRILSIAFILACLIIPISANQVSATTAPTLWEELSTGGDGDSAAIYASNFASMQFTTGDTAHTVTSVYLNLERVLAPGDIHVGIREASAGLPTGIDLSYGTLDGDNFSTTYGWYLFTLNDEIALEPSTQYSIVVSAPNGDAANYILWQWDSGGGLANAVASHSTDGGQAWTSDTPADLLFKIYGYTGFDILGARAYQNYLTSSSTQKDILFVLEGINDYPPYNNTVGVGTVFQIQLIDLDGVTVLAATPMTSWGRAPESIYISAASATSITVNGAYTLRMQANFGTLPYTDYTLTPSDWQGSDLKFLDEYIRSMAFRIQDYYQLTGDAVYLQNLTNQGEVLTNTGGAVFATAIAGITAVRPDLFSMAKSKPSFDLGTDQSTYDSTHLYTAKLGTEISGDLDTWGDLFSLDGDNFGGWLIALIAGLVLLGGVLLGGRAGVPLFILCGVPILFIGNYTGLIGIQWTLVMAFTMMILFVMGFWWKQT